MSEAGDHNFPFDSDEHTYAKFEKGQIEWERPKKEDGTEYTDEELYKQVKESISIINSHPLEWIELFDVLQSKFEYKLTKVENTVIEYIQDIETQSVDVHGSDKLQKEFYERMADPEKMKAHIENPPPVKHFYRRASLVRFFSFIVEGSVLDTFDDNYWIGKIAKWYDEKIRQGLLVPWVLSAGKLPMSLYDPVENCYVVPNASATKFNMSFEASSLSVFNMYKVLGGHAEKKEYKLEDILKLRKKVMYHLFAVCSPATDAAANAIQTTTWELYKKYDIKPTIEDMITYKGSYNRVLQTTWNQNEGEMPATVYDIKEQKQPNDTEVFRGGQVDFS